MVTSIPSPLEKKRCHGLSVETRQILAKGAANFVVVLCNLGVRGGFSEAGQVGFGAAARGEGGAEAALTCRRIALKASLC